jgi:predicted acyl esterase
LRAAPLLLALALVALAAACVNGAPAPALSRLPRPEPMAVVGAQITDGNVSVNPWQGAAAGYALREQPGGVELQRGGAAWYAVIGRYGKRSVPYLAPHELTLSTAGGPCWLAVYDHSAMQWKLHGEAIAPGRHTVPVGLGPNAAGADGTFRFALLALDAPVSISAITMRYPKQPRGALPVEYRQNIYAADGTRLSTYIYLPYEGSGPLRAQPPYPTVLVRTPYEKQTVGAEYVSWVSRFNAVVVIQYFRGRPGGSGKWPDSAGMPGMFDDHAGPEHTDAVDTVRWLRGRSFCSGDLLAIGGSALTLWIYQALPALGEELTAAYLIAGAGDVGNWATMQNGCYKLANVEGWIGSFNFPPQTLERVRGDAFDPRKLAQLDFNRSAAQVRTPGWHETGWWDIDVEETIRSYKALSERGGAGARGQQWLVIGPWVHEGFRRPAAGELRFSYASVDQNPTLLPLAWEGALWSAYQLGHNPFYTPPENRVRAFFVGEQGNRNAPNNTWYELPDWPPRFAPSTLRIDGGKLTRNEVKSAWSGRFDLDPRNPVKTHGGPNLQLGGRYGGMLAGPYDQRSVAAHPGVLRLRGEPLPQRLSIGGPVTAKLYVSTDAADTDVMVKLLDVYPDGRSLLIADRALRLSWWCRQQGLGPVQPGRVYEITYTVGERAWVFEAGHRIGFDVQASNHPRFGVNPGTGAALYDGDGVVQHNTLHAGPTQPSGFTLRVFYPSVLGRLASRPPWIVGPKHASAH